MAKQDDFVRITLRLPRELHGDLEHYGLPEHSLNAEIIRRLRYTVNMDMLGMELEARTPPPTLPTLSIDLDGRDRVVAWAEIHDRIAAVLAAVDGPIGMVHIEVIAKGLAVESDVTPRE